MAGSKEDVLLTEAYISEEYLVALFWCYPEFYSYYSTDKINKKTFGNKIWGWYFGLGRFVFDRGILQFDDISIEKAIEDTKTRSSFDEFGGYETMSEIMEEVKNKKDNFEGYYELVKKYQMLRQLRNTFGDKVLESNDKYNYHNLNKEQIHAYWMLKLKRIRN